MTIHDPAVVRQMVDKYLAAEQAVLKGKEVQLDGQTFRREDLPMIIQGRQEWEARLMASKRPGFGRRVRFGA